MTEFKLDYAGVGELLRSAEMHAVIDELAEAIGQQVRSASGLEVEVRSYDTDRGAASVNVLDPTAMFLEARDGLLSGAALSAGLDFKAARR